MDIIEDEWSFCLGMISWSTYFKFISWWVYEFIG